MNLEGLSRMERLEWALKETQRMHPVMSHYARYNAQAYDLGGYVIPQGWFTMVCPAVSHRLPEFFSRPNVYDPERFSPERAEDRKHPFSLIGFGAGLYRCPGAGFGTNEMKCILSMLLQRFEIEMVKPSPGRNFDMGVIRPTPPCMVRYRRRETRRASEHRHARLKHLAEAGMAPARP
jgi:sterol 14-demethylase